MSSVDANVTNEFPHTRWDLGITVHFPDSPFSEALRMDSFLTDLFRIAIDNDVCITITDDTVIQEFSP